jgi:hypothetical protein
MSNQPLDPNEVIQKIPSLVNASLVQCIRTAYSITDQIAQDFPILVSPHLASTLGQIRFALVNNVVAKSVHEGLVPGTAEWYPVAKASAHFMEYGIGDIRITFASSAALYKLPKNSDFRVSRAYDNQLSLFPRDEPLFNDEGPSVLMLHGYQNLNFVQFVMPGVTDGRIVPLAWSPNLLIAGEDRGQAESPTGGMPIDPIPVEPLVEIALELRTQTVEKIKESKTI